MNEPGLAQPSQITQAMTGHIKGDNKIKRTGRTTGYSKASQALPTNLNGNSKSKERALRWLRYIVKVVAAELDLHSFNKMVGSPHHLFLVSSSREISQAVEVRS